MHTRTPAEQDLTPGEGDGLEHGGEGLGTVSQEANVVGSDRDRWGGQFIGKAPRGHCYRGLSLRGFENPLAHRTDEDGPPS
jgi:hypothetical protein